MATLPLLAADIARRFTTSVPVLLAAAAGVLAIPQLTHIGATVSNDPWMIVLSTAALAGAARLATGDRRWPTAIATGVHAGLALRSEEHTSELQSIRRIPYAVFCLKKKKYNLHHYPTIIPTTPHHIANPNR